MLHGFGPVLQLMNQPNNISSITKSDKRDSPRIIFMGTPEFAVPSLRALADAELAPIAVITGPDKARGRGQKVSSTAVKVAAESLGIERILTPEDVKDPSFAEEIKALSPDIMVVVAFRILPEIVFSQAKLGTFNLHGSLLPKYRGAAPINRAIMAGDTETGVTTFLLQEKVDTGNMLIARKMSIGPNETAGEVHDRMSILGADVVVETVRLILSGNYVATSQDHGQASPAPKIFRDDCEIDWSRSAVDIHNQIRGLSPNPGAFTRFDHKQLKVFSSVLGPPVSKPKSGLVLATDASLRISCGSGSLELQTVQLEGKRAMSAAEFLRGNVVAIGTELGKA